MKKINLLVIGLFGIFAVGCSTTNPSRDEEMGGTTAVENALPYIIAQVAGGLLALELYKRI